MTIFNPTASRFLKPTLVAAAAIVCLWASPEGAKAEAVTGLRCEALFKSLGAQDLIKIFDASQTRSQHVRDNARDYWNYARVNGESFFGDLMGYRGLVVGDTHAGNFIVSPLAGQMRFFIADIKDAGHAPYVLDLARLVLSTQSVFKKGTVKTKETSEILLEAYLEGLMGGTAYVRPKSLDRLFQTSLPEYGRMQKDYVDAQTTGDFFRMKSGKVEPIRLAVENPARFQLLKNDIEAAVAGSFPGAKILDLAARPRERGGSKDLIRYWALVRYQSEKMILEFKEIGEPATALFGSQQDTVARYQEIMSTFWQVADTSYRVVEISGAHFWMRPKKTDVFRVPYKQKKDKEVDLLLDIAEYDAYYLGTLHGRQANSQAYAKAVMEKKAWLVGALKQFSKTYIKHLKQAIQTAELSGVEDGD